MKILLSLFLFVSFSWVQASWSGEPGRGETTALQYIDGLRKSHTEVSSYLWDNPELGMDEYKASAKLISYLERHGFKIEKGVGDIETAFVATSGSGKPVIGFLAEYDALPGLSQHAGKTQQHQIIEGAPGHGCGHHLLGTASCTAAIATAEAMKKHGIKGTVKLYGTPAQGNYTGKVFLATAGVFEGADAFITWHPADQNTIDHRSCFSLNSAKFQFRATPAYAESAPEQIRRGLDAVELMRIGVNFMQEHLVEQAKVHRFRTSGGGDANAAPSFAEAWYIIKAPRRTQTEKTFEWLKKIGEGAALMTGTGMTFDLLAATYELLPNNTLNRMGYEVMKRIGPPAFTEQDQKYGEELAKSLKLEVKAKAYSTDIKTPEVERRFPDVAVEEFSTDQGNVSWLAPTMSFSSATWAQKTPANSWQMVCQGKSEPAEKGALQASKWMAASALTLFSDAKLLELAKAEHAEYLKQTPYKDPVKGVPIPTFQKLHGIDRETIPGRSIN